MHNYLVYCVTPFFSILSSSGPQKCSACIREDLFEEPTSILKLGGVSRTLFSLLDSLAKLCQHQLACYCNDNNNNNNGINNNSSSRVGLQSTQDNKRNVVETGARYTKKG